jgi:hypothetical protein
MVYKLLLNLVGKKFLAVVINFLNYLTHPKVMFIRLMIGLKIGHHGLILIVILIMLILQVLFPDKLFQIGIMVLRQYGCINEQFLEWSIIQNYLV